MLIITTTETSYNFNEREFKTLFGEVAERFIDIQKDKDNYLRNTDEEYDLKLGGTYDSLCESIHKCAKDALPILSKFLGVKFSDNVDNHISLYQTIEVKAGKKVSTYSLFFVEEKSTETYKRVPLNIDV